MGDYFWIIQVRSLQEEDWRVEGWSKCDVGSRGQRRETWRYYTVGIEDEGRGQESRECRQPLEAGRSRKRLSSRASWKNQYEASLTLTQWNWFWTSDFQICKKLDCFKPLEFVVICYGSRHEYIMCPYFSYWYVNFLLYSKVIIVYVTNIFLRLQFAFKYFYNVFW